MRRNGLLCLLLALVGCSRTPSFRDVQKGTVPLAAAERQAVEALLGQAGLSPGDLHLAREGAWAEQEVAIADGHVVGLRLTGAVTDPSPLAALPRLARLSLGRAELADLRGVVGPELTVLDLTSSSVASADGLGSCPALAELSLRGGVASLAPLRACAALRKLHVTGGRLADLAALPPDLEELALSSTTVESLAGLAAVPALVRLSGTSNGLTVFDLPAMPALERLELRHNRLPEVVVPSMPALRVLALPENHVERLALGELPALGELDLSRNAITELQLPELPALATASLAGNQLADVHAFTFQTALERLDLEGNPVRSLEPLAGLPRLDTLRLRRTRVASVPAALRERNVRIEAEPGELEANEWQATLQASLEAQAGSWLDRLPGSGGSVRGRSRECAYRGGTFTRADLRCDVAIAELSGLVRLDLVEVDPLQRMSHGEVPAKATLSVERGVARIYFHEIQDPRGLAEGLSGYRDRDAPAISLGEREGRREGFRFAEARPGHPATLSGTLHWLGSGGGLWIGAEGGPAAGLRLHVE